MIVFIVWIFCVLIVVVIVREVAKNHPDRNFKDYEKELMMKHLDDINPRKK